MSEDNDKRVLIVGHGDTYNSLRMQGLGRMLGLRPGIVIFAEVHSQRDTEAYYEVLEIKQREALEQTMRTLRNAVRPKHGPRDRWGKCK